MPILNYTTGIDSFKTISEITQYLSKRGANKIVFDNDEYGVPCALTFSIPHDINGTQKNIPFTLPCNFEAILVLMKKDKKVPKRLCTKEQAARVGWRILKNWIEAQMALVDTEMVTMTEVFLSYAIMKDGGTVYKNLTSKSELLLNY